jgi:hypothetical protein
MGLAGSQANLRLQSSLYDPHSAVPWSPHRPPIHATCAGKISGFTLDIIIILVTIVIITTIAVAMVDYYMIFCFYLSCFNNSIALTATVTVIVDIIIITITTITFTTITIVISMWMGRDNEGGGGICVSSRAPHLQIWDLHQEL